MLQDNFEASVEELASQGGREQAARNDAIVEGRTADLSSLPMEGLKSYRDVGAATLTEHRCPHCGERTEREGVMSANEVRALAEQDADIAEPSREYTCGDCGGEWGPLISNAQQSARKCGGSSNGLKIERDRQQSNGVTRPSSGGKCRAVWDMLDGIGLDATAKQAREEAALLGLDKTTTMVQFYKWRKFNGVPGRQK